MSDIDELFDILDGKPGRSSEAEVIRESILRIIGGDHHGQWDPVLRSLWRDRSEHWSSKSNVPRAYERAAYRQLYLNTLARVYPHSLRQLYGIDPIPVHPSRERRSVRVPRDFQNLPQYVAIASYLVISLTGREVPGLEITEEQAAMIPLLTFRMLDDRVDLWWSRWGGGEGWLRDAAMASLLFAGSYVVANGEFDAGKPMRLGDRDASPPTGRPTPSLKIITEDWDFTKESAHAYLKRQFKESSAHWELVMEIQRMGTDLETTRPTSMRNPGKNRWLERLARQVSGCESLADLRAEYAKEHTNGRTKLQSEIGSTFDRQMREYGERVGLNPSQKSPP